LEFVRADLAPASASMSNRSKISPRAGDRAEPPIADEDRRLSPSDFGFHNVLHVRTACFSSWISEYAGGMIRRKPCATFSVNRVPRAETCTMPISPIALAETTLTPNAVPQPLRHAVADLSLEMVCIILNDSCRPAAVADALRSGFDDSDSQDSAIAKSAHRPGSMPERIISANWLRERWMD